MNDQRFLDQAVVPSRVRVVAGPAPIIPAPWVSASTSNAMVTKPNVWLGGDECVKGGSFHDGTGRLTPDDLGRST